MLQPSNTARHTIDFTLFKYIPLIVSWGVGEDSTAMLIEMIRLGVIPRAILFANTGGERAHTIEHFHRFSEWLVREGAPAPVEVSYQPKKFKNWPPYHSLEENCITNGTLPSLAFGFKSCSQKWKIAPQDKWVAEQPWARERWNQGGKIIKLIGYDASPADIRRRNHAGSAEDPAYIYLYPLQVWGWERSRCEELNRNTLGYQPGKSSCFFCPAMKPDEVRALTPGELRRIVVMEARAEPRLKSVEGLWRSSTKTRPGKMSDFIRQECLLPEEEMEMLQGSAPAEIISYQQGYAEALARGEASEYLNAHPHPHRDFALVS